MIKLRTWIPPLVLTLGIPCQELAFRLEGQGGVIRRGRELHRLGDVNADGWEDLIEYGEVATSTGRRSAVFVTSGHDGAVLSVSPPLPVSSYNFQSLSLTPAGDVDQDGTPDYAVTIYDAISPQSLQRVEVRSGLTHATLWTATIPNAWSSWFGWSLASDMDLDGDGRPDLVAAATQESPLGTLYVYDNAGNQRLRLLDPVPNVLVGVDLAPLHGDLDGDGFEDFLSAGPDTLNRGAVVVFSGNTGAVLRVSYGVQSGDKLSFCTACGDLDGDGVPDYAGGGYWGASVVTSFSGATGLPIHTWRDLTQPYMGLNLIGGFDLDQDGVNDIVVGQDQRAAHALSGRDGTFLWSHYRPNRGIGWAQAIIAPPPGEQYPIVIYSEREWSNSTVPPINPVGANGIMPGLLWAFCGNPNGVRAYGAPDASAGVTLPLSGMRDLPGQAVRWTLSNAGPNRLALLFLGVSNTNFGPMSLPAPLDWFGMPGLTLLSSGDVIVPTMTGVGGMANGYAQFDLQLPPSQSLSLTGTTLYSQWVWLDPLDLTRGGSTAGQRFVVQ